jgi:NADPH-dependent curcumin reductase CurA
VTNQQWRLRARPQGDVSREHFDVCHEPVTRPGPGEVLVRNIFLLIPASMRIWIEPWILDGSLKYQVDVLKELDSAPQALNRVFRGDNHGIQLVQVTTP